MPIFAKRKLVAGAAGLAVLAGSGGAYAAGQSGSAAYSTKPADVRAAQKAFLDDVAKRLNVTREQLDAALKGAAEARIDAAVAAGELTKEQGEAAKQRLSSGAPFLRGLAPIVGGHGPKPPGGPMGPGGRGLGFGLRGADSAAKYLGLTQEQLLEQLREFKSLADIAKATSGKSVEGLKAAIKADLTQRLDQAVKDGKLTKAQKDRIAANLDERIDAMVAMTPGDRPGRPRSRWR